MGLAAKIGVWSSRGAFLSTTNNVYRVIFPQLMRISTPDSRI